MACAVVSESPSRRAICAPRSQRACISERVTSPSSRIASSRCSLAEGERRPRAAVRAAHTNAGHGRAQSTRLEVRLAAWSSVPNSEAIRDEFAEQPASLSSSA